MKEEKRSKLNETKKKRTSFSQINQIAQCAQFNDRKQIYSIQMEFYFIHKGEKMKKCDSPIVNHHFSVRCLLFRPPRVRLSDRHQVSSSFERCEQEKP